MKNAITIGCMFVVVASLSLAALVGNIDTHLWSNPPRAFVAREWRAADPARASPRTVRSEMIEDLLARYDFKGWTKAEVIALLGDPDPRTAFEQWDMVYILGRERAGNFSLDDEAIGFRFDEKERVIEYGVSVN